MDNRVNRTRLIDGLRLLDFEPMPSHGNFVRVEGVVFPIDVDSSHHRRVR